MVGFACLVGTNLVPRGSNLEVRGEEECLVHTVVHVYLISEHLGKWVYYGYFLCNGDVKPANVFNCSSILISL